MRDWLPEGHLVWFVLDMVAQLDLDTFRARHRLGGAGREAYDPGMLLALLIYGYAVGERSSRQIERLCSVDVAFRVICAQDTPDHTTIARFRTAHADLFEQVFAQVLGLCARAGMGRLGTVAIDGTKIAANASIDANHREGWFREQARKIAAEAEAADAAEDAEFGPGNRGDELPAELADPKTRAERIRRCLAELEAEQAERDAAAAGDAAKAEQYLARLEDQRVTGRAPGGVDPVAAAQARLAREMTARQAEIDAYAAAVAAAGAEGSRLPRGRRVADPLGGKRVKKALAGLERALRTAATQDTKTGKDTTTASAGSDADRAVIRRNVTDPDSRILPTRGGWIQGYNAQLAVTGDWLILAVLLTNNPSDCAALIPMLNRTQQAAELVNGERDTPQELGTVLADAGYCSEDNLTTPGPDRLIATGKAHQIAVTARTDPASGPPPEDATPAEAMRHRLRTPDGAALYKKRAATVEPVNGHLKDRVGLRRFSMRGLDACHGELNLAALTHNLRRMFTHTHTTTQTT
ncbi:transposase [Amycolatopsis panacis]|nr:transposase [Amycolatopsis panacis]